MNDTRLAAGMQADNQVTDDSQRTMYQHGPRAQFVERNVFFAQQGWMIEANQPAGDHSSPPTDELILVQPISPGINLKKRWGDARFDGIAAVGSVWVVPPGTPIEIDLRVSHAIRVVGLGPYSGLGSLRDAIDTSALEKLAATPQRDRLICSWMEGLSTATRQNLDDPLFVAESFDALIERLAVLAEAPRVPFKGGLSARQTRLACDLLVARVVDGVTISELAYGTGLSHFHFIRAFKASLGVSPHRFLKLLRIQRAKDLLASTRRSILEIALDVGYDSGQTLSRSFRQEVGVTPISYREARQF